MEKTRYIDVVEAAKMLRGQLKKKFPGTKFSVRSEKFSGGTAIRVGWVDGPSEKKVKEIAAPYSGAGFDGMIDMAYYKTSILLPDGTVTYGSSPGTVSSRGVYDAYENPLPEGAERVSFGYNFVSTSRDYTKAALEKEIVRFNQEDLRAEEKPLRVEENQYGFGFYVRGDFEASGRFGREIQERDL